MLRAKLHAPAIDRDIICREKLLRKLRRVPELKLTLVTAPAGYGKTTLVLNWLQECGLPSAWLSLDARDNSPEVFWRYFCASLDGIQDGICRETDDVLSSPEMVRAHMHIDILIDKLAAVDSDFVLVLDDLHSLTDASIMKGLSHLIDYLPERMHLIFISRAMPEIGVARHKYKRHLQHLEEKDLRFEEDEISLFYRARGIALEDGDVKKIMDHTEGWAAALVAIAMSVGDHGAGRGVIAGLEAIGQDICRYLSDEVLCLWSAEKREFAMKTCILDTLSEGVCNAVTGRDNARRMLTEIYEGNGFLIALDAQRREYRYHHLFQGFLKTLLMETAPHEFAALHASAGLWFKARGMMPEAIGHLLEGSLYQEAFELIEHRIDSLIRNSDFGRLLPWVERLPESYQRRSFKIAAIYALYYAQAGSPDLSRRMLGRMRALREAYECGCDACSCGDAQAICTLVEANLLMREGNVQFVPLLVSVARNKARRMPGYNDFNLTDIYLYRCPVSVLAKLFAQAPDQFDGMIQSYRGMITENPGYAPLAIGEYHYENNRLEEALPYLLKAREEARAALCPGAYVPAMVDLARIRRAEGDLPGALEIVSECEGALRGMGSAHWLYLLAAFRCRLHMDMGDTAAVDAWLASSKLDLFTDLSQAREFELIVYARALAHKGKLRDARLLLKRLLPFAEENARHHSKVEILILLAILAYRADGFAKCAAYLESALATGLKEGYVRSLLDESAQIAQPLSSYAAPRVRQAEHPEAQALPGYAKDLLRQLRADIQAVPEPCAKSAAEGVEAQLTAQEKKVLELLANAKTNREIGLTLGISLATVKTHTGNIYGKLGVQSRAQCLKLIHEADLLK